MVSRKRLKLKSETAHERQTATAMIFRRSWVRFPFRKRYLNPLASLVLLMAVVVSARTQTIGREPDPAVLKLPIGPVGAPNERIPLPEALKVVGASLLDGNYVIFGLEMQLKDGKEPTVKLKFERRGFLLDVLNQIALQLRDYEFEFPSGHLITIYPKGADDDPEDLLNLRVARFDVKGERAATIFTQPGRYMPELERRLTSQQSHAHGLAQADEHAGTTPEGPPLYMRLGNFTVRQIFNLVSEATEKYVSTDAPTGWIYSFQTQPASSNVRAPSFRPLLTLPNDWLRHGEGPRKSSSP